MASAINWFEIPASDIDRAGKFYNTILDTQLADVDAGPGLTMKMFAAEDGTSGALVQGEGRNPSSSEGSVVYLNGGDDLSDVLNRVVAEHKDPAQTPVREVMTTKIACCEQSTTLEACRTVMTKNKIRHLPVIENGKLVGMISSGDILARELKEQEETIRYLHEYMQGPN